MTHHDSFDEVRVMINADLDSLNDMSNDEEEDADHRHEEPGDEQKTFFSRNRFKKLFF